MTTKLGARDLQNVHGIMRNQVVTDLNDVGVDPWKGVGTQIKPNVKTGAEALAQAGQDWEVGLVPAGAILESGKPAIVIPGMQAVVRLDTQTPLGVVGGRYTPVQNTAAISVFDPIVQSGRAVYDVAGVLYGGRKVWAMIRFNKEITLPGNDRVVRYLLYMNSHDGTTAVRVFPTPKRAACANVLAMFTAKFGKDGLSVRHTATAEERLREAERIVKISDEYYDTFEQRAAAMAERKMSDADVAKMLETMFPGSGEEPAQRTINMREKVMELFTYGAEHSEIRGTVWAALNAVVEYSDHHRATRQVGAVSEGESRLNSTLFGTGRTLKVKAYEYAADYMGFGV